jgi:hypothetical protein
VFPVKSGFIELENNDNDSLQPSLADPLVTLNLDRAEDQSYVATVYLGNDTFSQAFKLKIDTTSNILSVPDSTSKQFGRTNTYNCTASSSCIRVPPKIKEINKDGVEALGGYFALDTINLGNDVIAMNQTIFMALQNYKNTTSKFDGILGVNLVKEPFRGSSLLENLKSQFFVKHLIFSFYQASSQSNQTSQLILGGYNASYLVPGAIGFEYFPLATSERWSLNLSALSVNNTNLSIHSEEAVFDIGRLTVGVPEKYFGNFTSLLLQMKPDCRIDHQIICPCNGVNDTGFPNISFQFSSDSVFDFNSSSYLKSNGNGTCIISIESIPNNQNHWVLGNSFLQSYYALFDLEHEKIGLALSNSNPHSVIPVPSSNPSAGLALLRIVIVAATAFVVGLVFIIYFVCKKNNKRSRRANLLRRPLAFDLSCEEASDVEA